MRCAGVAQKPSVCSERLSRGFYENRLDIIGNNNTMTIVPT